MRKMITIRSLIITTLIVAAGACETEKKIFEGPYFVRFTKTEITEKESQIQPIEVEVHLAGPAPKHDVLVSYTIAGSAREGIDYTIAGTRGKVEIESGEYFGIVKIQLINNSNNILRSQDIVLSLLSVDSEGVQVGQGVSGIGSKFTLTVQDDCILGGNYYGIRTTADVPVTGITVTSSNCEEYLLSNWDIYVTSEYFPDVRDLVFIDNGDNTLTIPPQQESTLPTDLATIDGTGVVDPVTRRLTFSVRLVDVTNQPVTTFTLIPD